MVLRSAVYPCVIGLAALAGASAPSRAAEKQPTVVELFTSQGSSSCPPANANLIELGKRKDVLALSYAVTYWDYLGWKDTFGKEEFTDRQVTYEPALGEQGPFTPQMVINGSVSTVGVRLPEVEGLLAQASHDGGPQVTLADGHVMVGSGQAPSGGADVWLVHYDPKLVEVPVARGENSGRTLPHSHVVRDLVRLGTWDGNAASLKIPAAANGMRTAVLVQAQNGGPILAAATD
jgi:prepilin-type processing-associated H-X9-DG protein